MSSFTFYPNIPNAPDNPSFDQPLMQINSQSTNGLIGVDHVTFNQFNPSNTPQSPGQGGGQHIQVTFNSKNVPVGTPTDPLSILYTNSGVASTVADMYFKNQNSIFPISAVRAFGIINGTSGVTDPNQFINLTSSGGAGTYSITLNAGTVNSTSYGVYIGINSSISLTATYDNLLTSGFKVFTYKTVLGSLFAPTAFTVIVYQL